MKINLYDRDGELVEADVPMRQPNQYGHPFLDYYGREFRRGPNRDGHVAYYEESEIVDKPTR